MELLAGLERGHFKSLEWKYMGKDIIEFNSEVVYSPGSQFEGRLKMNTKNFSLTVRELTLQDSGDFLLTGEGDKGQIDSKTITLKVHGRLLSPFLHPILISFLFISITLMIFKL